MSISSEIKLKRVIGAAIYARYSSEMQSSSSARDQIDRIRLLISQGQVPTQLYLNTQIEVIQEWVQKDEAISGKVAGRRGYQKILNGIRQKAFNILFVDDLSRLTRSLGNLLELYQLLRHYDVELVSISDRVSSADPNARTFFTMKGMVADFGNEAHAERTYRGLEARARGGFSTGHKPYGYESIPTIKERRKGKEVASHYKLSINENHAEIVRRIFSMYAEGHGRIYIAKVLNEEKIPSPLAMASRGWKVGPLERMLKNEKYIGRWIFNKTYYSINPDTGKKVSKPRPQNEWVVTQSENLRIISQEIWDKVKKRLIENQEMRRKNLPRSGKEKIFGKRTRVHNLGLLTGNLSCSKCGGCCALISGRNGGYYGCIEAHRHGTCDHKFLIRKDVAERAVTEYINQNIISDPKVIQYATDQYNERMSTYIKHAPNRKQEIESELGKLSKQTQNLIRFITDGDASDLTTITDALREREMRISRLKKEMSSIEDTNTRNLLVTPYLIRSKLMEMAKSLKDNQLLKTLLEEPLSVSKELNCIEMNGRINLLMALNFGSRQCVNASPIEYYANNLVPITKEIKIKIKNKRLNSNNG